MQKTTKFTISGLEEYDVQGATMFAWGKQVSDEYHSMEELYEHRYALFAALVRIYDGYITPLGATAVTAWKSKFHSDGTMFDGYFIAGIGRKNIDGTSFQISYHLPLNWWNKFQCAALSRAPEYDGHTSKDVIERLGKL